MDKKGFTSERLATVVPVKREAIGDAGHRAKEVCAVALRAIISPCWLWQAK